MLENRKFAMDAQAAANKSLKYLQESGKLAQPKIGADTYNGLLMESKLEKDATFLVTMGKDLDDSKKELFYENLGLLMEATKSLFEEVNMKPRTCSRAIDGDEITENVQNELYAKHITDAVNKDFTKPLFEGTLLQDNKDNAKLLMEASISAGLDQSIDSEVFLKYAIFENTIVGNIKKILLPETLEERTATFIGVQDKNYFEIFENSADVLLERIEESSLVIGSLVAPALFVGSLEESSEIKLSDVASFAGISKAIK